MKKKIKIMQNKVVELTNNLQNTEKDNYVNVSKEAQVEINETSIHYESIQNFEASNEGNTDSYLLGNWDNAVENVQCPNVDIPTSEPTEFLFNEGNCLYFNQLYSF